MLNPELIIADEPVSALDVSIQAQVINLLEELQDALGLTYVVIAHDLAVVRHISDVIGVMYLGAIVEQAAADDLYREPLHPYTKALMSAVPIPDPLVEDTRERILIPGDLPSPANPPPGCRFHTRCPFRQETRCDDERPLLRVIRDDHQVACHWVEEIESGQITPNASVHDPRAAALEDVESQVGLDRRHGRGTSTATRVTSASSRSRSTCSTSAGVSSTVSISTGNGGGVPPNAGQIAWCEHHSQNRLGFGRQSCCLVGALDRLPDRDDLALGRAQVGLVGLVPEHLAAAEVDQLQQPRHDAAQLPQHERVEPHLEERPRLEPLARRLAGLVVDHPELAAGRDVEAVDVAAQAQPALELGLHVELALGRLEPAGVLEQEVAVEQVRGGARTTRPAPRRCRRQRGERRARPRRAAPRRRGASRRRGRACARPRRGRRGARARRARASRAPPPSSGSSGSRSRVRNRNSSGQVMKSPARDGDSPVSGPARRVGSGRSAGVALRAVTTSTMPARLREPSDDSGRRAVGTRAGPYDHGVSESDEAPTGSRQRRAAGGGFRVGVLFGIPIYRHPGLGRGRARHHLIYQPQSRDYVAGPDRGVELRPRVPDRACSSTPRWWRTSSATRWWPRRFGLPVNRITLHILGGMSEIGEEPQTPRREFAVAAAGPALSLVVGGVAYAVYQALEQYTVAWVLVQALAYANLLVGVFNLLPGLPLDGGRVLRAIVWAVTGNPITGDPGRSARRAGARRVVLHARRVSVAFGSGASRPGVPALGRAARRVHLGRVPTRHCSARGCAAGSRTMSVRGLSRRAIPVAARPAAVRGDPPGAERRGRRAGGDRLRTGSRRRW